MVFPDLTMEMYQAHTATLWWIMKKHGLSWAQFNNFEQ